MNAPARVKPAVDEEAQIEHYLNEGWDGTGWPPYKLFVIGESALSTGYTRRGYEHPDAKENAAQYREVVLTRARQLWMRGFYADPFTRTPKRRR